ncbi:head GIN domain-containing protein [uncultured Fibrella sp.]|uniref:head GIN domain-containing protein n=1 Tax=uncultured Fibrella sp. TaxID=1284596 RepID=UPI0035CAB088
MKTPLLITYLAMCLTLTSCLSAQDVKRNQTFAGIAGLDVSAGINVYLTQGSTESVRIEARGFEDDEVISELRGGKLVLTIRRQNGWKGVFGRNNSVKAYVTVKNLNSIEVSSGADLEGETNLVADDLTLNTSSGADVKLDVKVNRMTVSVSSGADVTLSGSAAKLTASVSSGADLDADKLVTDVCYAEASGGGDARVHGRKELYLRASGGGDVTYSGPGQLVSRKTSGGGDINRD